MCFYSHFLVDGALNDTYISVRNSNFITATSERRTIEGKAWIPSLEDPGKLKLLLDGVPVIGDCKYHYLIEYESKTQ